MRRKGRRDATDWSMLALAAAKAGHHRDACEHFERAIEARPNSAAPRYNQAIALERCGGDR